MGWEFLTGALVALVASTIIPFATTQFSLWSQRRRSVVVARRRALDKLWVITAQVEMEHLAKFPQGGSRVSTGVANDPRRQAAVARLQAQFSLSDRAVHDAWTAAGSSNPEVRLILSSWANGHNATARRAARVFVAGSTSDRP